MATTTPKPKEAKVPQAAAAPPTPQTAPPASDATLYRGDPDALPGTPDWLIARAIQLEQDRAKVQERVGANRRSLRDLDAQDALNEEQAEFLDVWYPEKERGERRAKEDIEATRKAREAARKDGTAK